MKEDFQDLIEQLGGLSAGQLWGGVRPGERGHQELAPDFRS
jgi:hypothetical protein